MTFLAPSSTAVVGWEFGSQVDDNVAEERNAHKPSNLCTTTRYLCFRVLLLRLPKGLGKNERPSGTFSQELRQIDNLKIPFTVLPKQR